jgi:aerobic-type carbon monoxide dehydrogenase small subunit (CoxS/CutS family)
MQQTIQFTVNGETRSVTTDPDRLLLEVLREELGLTGAKYGCGERQCGACTVLVNDRPVFSCSTRIATVANRKVVTIEGLAEDGQLHPVQEAFLECGAMQCGYCTPGMIMRAVALLRQTPRPNDDEIRSGMQRNVCRCCGYVQIIEAVRQASQSNEGGDS